QGEQQGLAVEHAQLQLARSLDMAGLVAHETHVDLVGQQGRELWLGVHLAQLDVHLGRHLPVAQQGARQGGVERYRQRVGQPQLAAVAGRRRRGATACQFGLRQDLSRLFQEDPSGLGQGDSALAAFEQRYAEIPFQRLDLLGKRWLRDVQADRGAGEAQLLGDRDEVAQLTEVKHSRNAYKERSKYILDT